MSDATERPPIAVCTTCSRYAEVRWLHAETGEPALPYCCGLPMVLSQREFRLVWHDEADGGGSFRSWSTWEPVDA